MSPFAGQPSLAISVSFRHDCGRLKPGTLADAMHGVFNNVYLGATLRTLFHLPLYRQHACFSAGRSVSATF